MSPIDPRFDPRFQRGYTGEGAAKGAREGAREDAAGEPEPTVSRTRERAASARRVEVPDAVLPDDSVAESARYARESRADHALSDQTWTLDELGLGPTAGDGRQSDGRHGDSRDSHEDGIDAMELEAEELARETWGRHRNPWLISLWVVSGALVVLPLLAFWQCIMVQSTLQWTDAGPPIEFIISQFVIQSAPSVLIMGGLGLLVAICVNAVAWNARDARRPAIDEATAHNDANDHARPGGPEALTSSNESAPR